MKTNLIDYSSSDVLQKLIITWREIVGIDPVYLIHLKIGITENSDLAANPAWVEGLTIDNTHPVVNLCINAEWLEKNRYNQREIEETIIHELLHISIWLVLVMIDPKYEYKGIKALGNEILTMKMTNAIIKTKYNLTQNKRSV